MRLPPEQILLRWLNYPLNNVKWERRFVTRILHPFLLLIYYAVEFQTFPAMSKTEKITRFYSISLHQIPVAEHRCPRSSPTSRADPNADKLDCRKILTPTSLVAENPKLNLAFVANVFNTHPGLGPITEEEKLEIEDFDAEGEREASVFTLWLNSLDARSVVNSLFDDLSDGGILLQAYDKVVPAGVNCRHVNQPPAASSCASKRSKILTMRLNSANRCDSPLPAPSDLYGSRSAATSQRPSRRLHRASVSARLRMSGCFCDSEKGRKILSLYLSCCYSEPFAVAAHSLDILPSVWDRPIRSMGKPKTRKFALGIKLGMEKGKEEAKATMSPG